MIYSKSIFGFFTYIVIVEAASHYSMIVSITKEFQIKHPMIITNPNSVSSNQIMKRQFYSNQFTRIVNNLDEDSLRKYCELDIPLIVFFKDLMKQNLEKYFCWPTSLIVILEENELDYALQSIEVSIEKEALFVIESTSEVYEAYRINDRTIKRKLGQINQFDGNFVWKDNVEQDFIKRRANFQGVNLKAMTETTGNELALDPKYLEEAPYFPSNETYEVSKYTYGIYFDVLMELQRELNFTTVLYKRKDLAWGFIYPQENGSYIATGIVGDLFFNKVDFCVAPLATFYRRALYIDFLLPLTQKIIGLYIPTTSNEDFDFQTFFTPFRYFGDRSQLS